MTAAEKTIYEAGVEAAAEHAHSNEGSPHPNSSLVQLMTTAPVTLSVPMTPAQQATYDAGVVAAGEAAHNNEAPLNVNH